VLDDRKDIQARCKKTYSTRFSSETHGGPEGDGLKKQSLNRSSNISFIAVVSVVIAALTGSVKQVYHKPDAYISRCKQTASSNRTKTKKKTVYCVVVSHALKGCN